MTVCLIMVSWYVYTSTKTKRFFCQNDTHSHWSAKTTKPLYYAARPVVFNVTLWKKHFAPIDWTCNMHACIWCHRLHKFKLIFCSLHQNNNGILSFKKKSLWIMFLKVSIFKTPKHSWCVNEWQKSIKGFPFLVETDVWLHLQHNVTSLENCILRATRRLIGKSSLSL